MQVGQNVTGNYYGIKFSGVVQSKRALTVKTDGCFEYFVALEDPISVFGREASELVVFAKFDGSPSRYTKFQNEIGAA